jgi:hypothetical protein
LVAFKIGVFIRTLQKHSQIVNGAGIAFSNVNDYARLGLLSNCDFTSVFKWFKSDRWLLDEQMFFVDVRSYLDGHTWSHIVDSTL